MAKKKPQKKKSAKARVSKVIDQVKEPFSLLGTLKEEGLANALTLLSVASTVASGAKEKLRVDAVKPQLRELISSLGFALREDFERLAARVDDLEHQLSEREYDRLKGHDDEE